MDTQTFLHPALDIPAAAQAKLLPCLALSVCELLKFPFSIVSRTTNTHPKSAYFSGNAPTHLDASTIQKIPMPCAETVGELGRGCSTSEFLGAKSLLCAHIPSAEYYLPLWVITFWTEVIELRTKWLEPWVHAEDALRRRKTVWRRQTDPNVTHTLVGEVMDVLSILPWSGDVRGFDNAEPVYHLATYATREWFSCVHQNQMLDILRRDLMLDPQYSKIRIENLSFTAVLKTAHKTRNSGEYGNSRHFAWIHDQGKALATGLYNLLGLEANVRGDHWVSMVLDFRNAEILYGDSFAMPPEAELVAAVDWWTHYHTGQRFTHQTLPISRQIDRFSCGLLAHNALTHYFLPSLHPLIETANADNERLKVFLEVVRRHLDQVCQ
jgi:hypothetical protein